MYKTLAIVVAAGALLAAGAWAFGTGAGSPANVENARAQTGEIGTLAIEGMTCSGCAVAVKMAAQSIEGVATADVNLENSTAHVRYDPTKTTPEAIARVVTERTGFKAAPARTPAS